MQHSHGIQQEGTGFTREAFFFQASANESFFFPGPFRGMRFPLLRKQLGSIQSDELIHGGRAGAGFDQARGRFNGHFSFHVLIRAWVGLS